MTYWITDRQPTEADGDKDEAVLMRLFHDRRPSPIGPTVTLVDWRHVGPGVPWQHTGIWNPPAEAAPEPAPLAAPSTTEIPEPIRTGAAPFYVLVVSDDHPSVGGQPTVWEHPVFSETTLSAVLRRRAGIGSKYGTTFIAECRIIPELTREVAQ